jgi:hypothetical protein
MEHQERQESHEQQEGGFDDERGEEGERSQRHEGGERGQGVEGDTRGQQGVNENSNDDIVEVPSPMMRFMALHPRVHVARRRRVLISVQRGARRAVWQWLGEEGMRRRTMYRVYNALARDREVATMFMALSRAQRGAMLEVILCRADDLLGPETEKREGDSDDESPMDSDDDPED